MSKYGKNLNAEEKHILEVMKGVFNDALELTKIQLQTGTSRKHIKESLQYNLEKLLNSYFFNEEESADAE